METLSRQVRISSPAGASPTCMYAVQRNGADIVLFVPKVDSMCPCWRVSSCCIGAQYQTDASRLLGELKYFQVGRRRHEEQDSKLQIVGCWTGSADESP